MEVNPRFIKVARLFEEPNIFTVPKYQRNYAWEDEQITDFLADIQKCYNSFTVGETYEHFYGGVVTISSKRSSSNCDDHEIVDGQQRLTTFTLFLMAIMRSYEHILKTSDDIEEDQVLTFRRRISKIKEVYLCYEEEINGRYQNVDKLTISKADNDYYKAIKDLTKLTEERESHKRLNKAYKQFCSFLTKEASIETSNQEKLNIVYNFQRAFESCSTVLLIQTVSKTDAYRLFQVLNDRGISLTEGDMLRAKTLELLESKISMSEMNSINDLWDKILSDTTSNIVDYLKYFYASQQGKRCSSNSVYDEFLNIFFPEHKNDIISDTDVRNINEMIKKIYSSNTNFKKLINGEWPFPIKQPVTAKERNRLAVLITKLNHKGIMPLLLNAINLGDKKFRDIIHIVEMSFFRYKLICGLHIGKMDKIYLDYAVRIKENRFSMHDFKNDLRYLLADANDELFKTSLCSLKYKPKGDNKTLKYFLLTLEDYSNWYFSGERSLRGKAVNDNALMHDFNNVSIEHIYSQSSQDTDEVLEEVKHNLGNLTIFNCTGNSEDLGNKSYEEKKEIFGRQGGYIINQRIASISEWNIDEVNKRQEELLSMAIAIFQI
jgi:intergrase/recombinase